MGRITRLQFWAVYYTFIFSTTIAFLIGPLAHKTGYDGWICILLGALAGTGLTIAVTAFAFRRPNEYFGLYGHQVVGRPLHIVIMLLFSLYFLHLASYILREFLDFFSQTYLRETPEWAIAVFLMFAVVCLVQVGEGAIFRFAQGCFLLIGMMFMVKPLFFIANLNPSALEAFTTIHNARAVWSETYSLIPWYGELFMVMFFVPELKKPGSTKKLIWTASLAGTYILASEYVLIILFFGPELSGTLTYPALELAGFIRLGDFLQNLDPVIVSVWFMAYFIKLSIVFYAGVLTFSHMLGVSEFRFMTMPLGAIVVTLALALARSPIELGSFFDRSWATFALFVECLPLIYPLVAWVRSWKAGGADQPPAAQKVE